MSVAFRFVFFCQTATKPFQKRKAPIEGSFITGMVAGSIVGVNGPELETVSLTDFPDVVVATHLGTVACRDRRVQVFGEVVVVRSEVVAAG